MAHTTTTSAFGHADGCGCCTPAGAGAAPRNRPGATALSHRAGTYDSFLRAMLDGLADQPGLRALTTRDTSDPLVAVLEAWASVGEVLATQHERFADEGFLRTADTRDAVQLHARALGYELRPGLAASTTLVFGLRLPPDGPDELLLEPGIAAQSVPPDGEHPQVFETVEAVLAHRDLDDLRPARTETVRPGSAGTLVVLAGTDTGVRTGDLLLLVVVDGSSVPAGGRWTTGRVASVDARPADPADDAIEPHTLVTLEAPVTGLPATGEVEVHLLAEGVPLFGNAAPAWPQLPVALRIGEVNPDPEAAGALVPGPYAGRQTSWVDASLSDSADELELARRVDGVVAGSWAVIADADDQSLLAVTGTTQRSLADYLLTAEATVLSILDSDLSAFDRRTATVWCVSERLPLGTRPLATPVADSLVTLATATDALAAGRSLVVEGTVAEHDLGAAAGEEPVPAPGETVAHVTTALLVCPWTAPAGGATTRVVLADPLPAPLRRDSVHLRANVAVATHGTSRQVVLGSGDASRPHQSFVLPEPDLTHVPVELVDDPTPLARTRGAASTLEVRVDGLPWEQVQTLHGAAPGATVFTARARAGDGRVVVCFGDGVFGARLPSGTDNVVATYRVGTGSAGQVDAEALSVLLSRPLGLTSVRNPLPATGGADPEPLDEARENAPVLVRTLDRLVSLADVADLARSHAGVRAARAAWVWHGHERVVHVTIVPVDGRVLPIDDPLLTSVADALDGARHPGAPIVVAPHVPVLAAVTAGIVVDPDRDADGVIATATASLTTTYAAATRTLASSLAASELVASLHDVAGVVGVDVDEFHVLPSDGSAPPALLVPAVVGRAARVELGVLRAAELVSLDPTAITLTEVTS